MDLRAPSSNVPETAGMDVAASRNIRKDWADNDERKELFPRPLLGLVVLANKRAFRHTQEAPAIRAALGV